MHPVIRSAFQPLNLTGIVAVGSVGLSLRWLDAALRVPAITVLLAFLACFLVQETVQRYSIRAHHALLLLMPVLALSLLAIAPRIGTAQILLVVWTAVLVMCWPPLWAIIAALLADVVVWFLLKQSGHSGPLTMVLLYAGFQAFAALCVHYAHSAEQARDRLALVNADLLATRALLADSARDNERLRVARELHDVAGHKLTALRLNLRALQAAQPSPQLQLAEQLSAELLNDIRNVVQELRDARGLDMDTALRALAVSFPRPVLDLRIDVDVNISDATLAEALLRTVQEALTNAARHSQAQTLSVQLRHEHETLCLCIEDDGRAHLPLREGNGLAGMRERIGALGGTLTLATSATGGLRIDVMVPA